MIGSLRGSVTERRAVGDSVEVVLDVGGVGYRVVVTPRTASNLPLGGGTVALSVHTHVREAAITLYGFDSPRERATFELLLGAHGVGPGLALAILGVHGADAIADLVASKDVEALKLVPGVGQKTAARLLLELQSRFAAVEPDGLAPGGGAAIGGARTQLGEVAEALAQLGYGPDEVRSVLGGLAAEEVAGRSVEELLRTALRSIGARR